MYRCAIEYEGDEILLNQAVFQSCTINSNTVAEARNLKELPSIKGYIEANLSVLGITASSVIATSNNRGESENIALNTGYNIVYVTIFYPSAELTGSIDVTINGTLETFNFEKIATV